MALSKEGKQSATREAVSYSSIYNVPVAPIKAAASMIYAGKSPVKVARAFIDKPYHSVICDYLLNTHPGAGRDPKQIKAIKVFYGMSLEERAKFMQDVLDHNYARTHPEQKTA